MSLIILTQAERDKFAAYCEQEIEQEKGMLEQLKKLHPDGPVFEAMSKVYKTRVIGFSIVAKELRSWEEQTVGG